MKYFIFIMIGFGFTMTMSKTIDMNRFEFFVASLTWPAAVGVIMADEAIEILRLDQTNIKR